MTPLRLTVAGLLLAAPLPGAITAYTFSGFVSTVDPDLYGIVQDFEDVAGGFSVDDSVAASYSGTTGQGASYQAFDGALRDFSLSFPGTGGGVQVGLESVFNADNGSNHQFSFFLSPSSAGYGTTGSFQDSLAVTLPPGGGGTASLEYSLSSIDLFFLDTDSGLFSQTPPELVAPDLGTTDFEIMDATLHFTGYAYDAFGEQIGDPIEAAIQIQITALASDGIVPIPEPRAAALGLGLLVALCAARRRR